MLTTCTAGKVQEEIARTLESRQLPTFDDKKRMPFTNAVIHEVQRFVCLLPAVPRYTAVDAHFQGYVIPKVWYLKPGGVNLPRTREMLVRLPFGSQLSAFPFLSSLSFLCKIPVTQDGDDTWKDKRNRESRVNPLGLLCSFHPFSFFHSFSFLAWKLGQAEPLPSSCLSAGACAVLVRTKPCCRFPPIDTRLFCVSGHDCDPFAHIRAVGRETVGDAPSV